MEIDRNLQKALCLIGKMTTVQQLEALASATVLFKETGEPVPPVENYVRFFSGAEIQKAIQNTERRKNDERFSDIATGSLEWLYTLQAAAVK